MGGHLVIQRGRVAAITLNRPERRNALSAGMLQDMVQALDELAADDACRCVIVRGEGDHFCAGADVGDLGAGTAEGARYGAGFEALLRAIEECPLPVVARVQGAALGAGCQLLAAVDLSVAAEDAVIGIPAARIGILLDLEMVGRMVREIGPARAREMLLTARSLNGVDAAGCGLVTKAVPRAALDDETDALAERVASCAPLSVRGSKGAIRAILRAGAIGRSRDAAAFAENDAAALRALTSEDLREGLQALAEKRAPKFLGR